MQFYKYVLLVLPTCAGPIKQSRAKLLFNDLMMLFCTKCFFIFNEKSFFLILAPKKESIRCVDYFFYFCFLTKKKLGERDQKGATKNEQDGLEKEREKEKDNERKSERRREKSLERLKNVKNNFFSPLSPIHCSYICVLPHRWRG